ncbi:hypothetical protein LTS15_010833 [Exophiala xenobiotica]|nr:hypothetical protein LTS15_010833 [Exophiala xenobiotica]
MTNHFTYADGIAVAEEVYYAPALLVSLYVTFKHGFSKGSGWIFLTIFCIIRIVGSAAQLATINKTDPQTAETIALVCAVLGLSPLVLSTLGILARVYYSMLKQPWNTIFSLVLLRAIQIPALVALILCIIGATNTNDPAQIYSQSIVHVGVILYAVVFAALVLLTGGAILGWRKTTRGELPLIIGISITLPFLAVRVLYALLAAFSNDSKFNPATGSKTVMLFMDILQEMAVVLIYLATGVMAPAVPKADDDQPRSRGSKLMYRAGRGDFNGGRLGLLSLAVAAWTGKKDEDRHGRHGNRGAKEEGSQSGYPLSSQQRYGSSDV